MPPIEINHVLYDDQYNGFRATAIVRGKTTQRLACFWPGPARADLANVARGLAADAAQRFAQTSTA